MLDMDVEYDKVKNKTKLWMGWLMLTPKPAECAYGCVDAPYWQGLRAGQLTSLDARQGTESTEMSVQAEKMDRGACVVRPSCQRTQGRRGGRRAGQDTNGFNLTHSLVGLGLGGQFGGPVRCNGTARLVERLTPRVEAAIE